MVILKLHRTRKVNIIFDILDNNNPLFFTNPLKSGTIIG